MKFRSFVFERDEAEEAHLRAQGWKLKDTDHAYRMSFDKLTFGARWKVCRSKLDVAVYFLRSFAWYVKANILHLLESSREPRHNQEPDRSIRKNGSKDIVR